MIPLHDDNPTNSNPILTIFFIVVCILVFIWQLTLNMQQAVYTFGVIPAVLFNIKTLPPEVSSIPSWTTILTSMFMHGGWMHLIGNMLYLWIFGNNVEDAMGHKRFIIFYLLCGTLAVVAHGMSNTHSEVPLIGASGAISGVLGAYLLLYPRAKVLVILPLGFILTTLRLPASMVLAFWFIFQLINTALSGSQEGGTAWGAHIGGFIAGMLLIPFFKYKKVHLFAAKRPYYR